MSPSRSPDDRPTSAYDYELPRDRIAFHPADRRDESRLLVLRRDTGRIEHRIFRDLVDLVPPGDAIVVNETRVFPARLRGRKPTGARAEVLLLHPAAEGSDDTWAAMVRPGARLKPGSVVDIAEDLRIEIVAALPGGRRLVRVISPLPLDRALEQYGEVPLPPYIERTPGPDDRDRYQTVYARERGSVAAPTAGLHFTPELLHALQNRGVLLVRLVLHVGIGTFRPVETEDPAAHTMHEERFEIGEESAATLNRVRAAGGRIWAVGTTVTRTLETCAAPDGTLNAGSGWTGLFIRPPYRFRAVDRLITNFHLPRSTLLMLVCAFGGYEPVMRAYREAIDGPYRFFSYGDAMALI